MAFDKHNVIPQFQTPMDYLLQTCYGRMSEGVLLQIKISYSALHALIYIACDFALEYPRECWQLITPNLTLIILKIKDSLGLNNIFPIA